MKYELMKVTNTESKGNREVGNIGRFDFDGKVFFFGDIRSSRVRQITINDANEMIVQTKNSTYFFKESNNV